MVVVLHTSNEVNVQLPPSRCTTSSTSSTNAATTPPHASPRYTHTRARAHRVFFILQTRGTTRQHDIAYAYYALLKFELFRAIYTYPQ